LHVAHVCRCVSSAKKPLIYATFYHTFLFIYVTDP